MALETCEIGNERRCITLRSHWNRFRPLLHPEPHWKDQYAPPYSLVDILSVSVSYVNHHHHIFFIRKLTDATHYINWKGRKTNKMIYKNTIGCRPKTPDTVVETWQDTNITMSVMIYLLLLVQISDFLSFVHSDHLFLPRSVPPSQHTLTMTDLSRRLDAFDDTDVDQDPGQQQTTCKMPLYFTNVANVCVICGTKNLISTQTTLSSLHKRHSHTTSLSRHSYINRQK